MQYLKQSTASQSVVIGPFVDSTDGNTVESGLTVDAADIRLSKNGANIVGKNSGGGTHDELGYYTITFDATDTDTVGRLQLMVHESGALPVYHEFSVLEEAVYDALYGASALGYVANAPVNVAQISGDSTAADNLETAFDDTAGAVPWQLISDQGTLQSVTNTTTIVLRAAASAEDDVYIGHTIHFVSGTTGVKQSALISDYVGSSKTATLAAAVPIALTGTIVYKIVATAPASGGGTAPTAAEVADAVWDEATAGHTTSGTFGEQLKTDVDAIIAKTASLTFTVANVLDVNTLRMAGTVVLGNGTGGNLWRG